MALKLIEPADVFSERELKTLENWISRYGNPLLLLFKGKAERVFQEFDQQFFKRTGLTEKEYIDSLINEARRIASIKFTEMPNGANETMFDSPE